MSLRGRQSGCYEIAPRAVPLEVLEEDDEDDEDDGTDETEVVSDEINIIVAHIKRLARTAHLEFALRVGAVIIHHFYQGDTDAWRRRGPKTASFRRLAAHPELPLSPGSLYRCVALYELCDRLNAPSRWQNLGASHLRVVLGLPSPTQERLLAMANSERWSVKVLHEQVLLEKTTRSTRGGRRAQSPITKSLISLKKCLAHYHDLMGRGGHPSPQDAEQVMALLAEASSSLASLTESLQEALGPDTDE